jgi:hypothetical protein
MNDETKKYKFKEFFRVNSGYEGYDVSSPPNKWIDEIKADFEIFVNETEMGRNFAAQLREVRDGNEDHEGIGKINFVKGTKSTPKLLGLSQEERYFSALACYSYENIKNQKLIIFGPKIGKTRLIAQDGSQYSPSKTETFLHELKHIVDMGYLKLYGGDVRLREFDAIVFSNNAMIEIGKAKKTIAENEALDKQRDPNIYFMEKKIKRGEVSYLDIKILEAEKSRDKICEDKVLTIKPAEVVIANSSIATKILEALDY